MRKRRLQALLALGAALVVVGALVTAAQSGAQPHPRLLDASRRVQAYVTYYGWYDNTPPGCVTAYSGCAGGTGTYKDPITFASSTREFPVGTIVYYPTVRKYFRMGDACQECQADWTGRGPDGGPHLHHIDLWIGGRSANEFDAINCEDALTAGRPNGAPLLTPLIVDPRPDLATSTEPLFNAKTNRCFEGKHSHSTYGRYRNQSTGECLAQAAGGTKSRAAAVTAPCGTAADEDLAFDGAFFIVNHLCLTTQGTKFGSRLDFASCSGGPRQQWETGSHGTIAWIQYLECVADRHGRVELAACKRSRADRANRWSYVPEPKP